MSDNRIGISFNIEQGIYSVLCSMFQNLDVTQFVWLNALSQTEVYGFDDFNREEAIFTESFYSGKEFLNEIKKNYLVLNLKIGAFKFEKDRRRIHSYKDFLDSGCEILLLIYDAENVEIFIKNKKILDLIYQNAAVNHYKDIKYITDSDNHRYIMDIR